MQEYYKFDECGTYLQMHAVAATSGSGSAGQSSSWADILARASRAEARVAELEQKFAVGRAKKAVSNAKVFSAVFKWVPEDYYARSLEERAVLLGGAAPHQLCKTIVFENLACTRDDCEDVRNSKFYCAVVQYEAKLDTEKLRSFIHSLNDNQLSKKKFNFQLAPAETSDRLTGFSHNAVTPFGMLENIPVIVSEAVTKLDPAFLWLGGGHTLLKLGMTVQDLMHSLKPFVADISAPRA